MRISTLKTDRTKEENGVWLEVAEGLKVLVARAGNHKYQDTYRKMVRQRFGTLRLSDVDAKAQEEVQADAMAQTILLGWKNLQDDAGNDIPYSVAKAAELLKTHREFLRIVLELSADYTNFREEQVAAAAKN